MKIRSNDTVVIIAGKDKGKKGKVLKVFTDKDMVLVEGINRVKKHVKPGVVNDEGGIITFEKPIHVSNVMYWDEKAEKASRIGYEVDKDGKKWRVSKVSKKLIDK